ncbi:MAG: N-formylglutamate amidohydrolase [Pseudomonadota bacterium]
MAGRAPPLEVVNQQGQSAIVLLCEHAGRIIPTELGTLGLSESDRSSHIAWDIGARGLSLLLAERLDAVLAMQRYSRLVYDCNRDWGAPDESPEKVDFTFIPGNRGLSEAERRRRRNDIYAPFHDGVRRLIDERRQEGRPAVIVTIHSFTPVYEGRRRALDIGIVHDSDARLADIMLAAESRPSGLDIRRNEPYGPDRGVTHTLKVQAVALGLLNVMIEVRNELIADVDGQAKFAEHLANWMAQSADQALSDTARAVST